MSLYCPYCNKEYKRSKYFFDKHVEECKLGGSKNNFTSMRNVTVNASKRVFSHERAVVSVDSRTIQYNVLRINQAQQVQRVQNEVLYDELDFPDGLAFNSVTNSTANSELAPKFELIQKQYEKLKNEETELNQKQDERRANKEKLKNLAKILRQDKKDANKRKKRLKILSIKKGQIVKQLDKKKNTSISFKLLGRPKAFLKKLFNVH